MQVSITREYTWEMGHALMRHKGKCYHPHGHNYRMEVEVSGPINEVSNMIWDFADLDELVNPIVRELDHQFLAHPDDARFEGFGDDCLRWAEGDPTAESIASYFFQALTGWGVILERVTIYETDKASATVRRS
jgi:6-pyruvoyltetrahydropterin/6-carboxytetrahydropterin synthase